MPINPLVSIVMCTYNGEKYLRLQLDSIIAQTYSNIEIVIVDDCSTDSTPEILKEYASSHSNILVVFNEKNLGVDENFEKGILAAKGDFIALSDQDDVWYSAKIEFLLNNIGENILIHHDSLLVDENGKSSGRTFAQIAKFIGGHDCMPFFFNNCILGHSVLFKKELIKSFIPMNIPKGIGLVYDNLIALAAAAVGNIAYTDQVFVEYRQHSGSITDLSGLKTRQISRKERKLKNVEDISRRFEHLALMTCIPIQDKGLADTLVKLYKKRLSQSFSVSLFMFLLKNRSRLFKISHKSEWKIIRNCFTLSFGVK